MTQGIHLPTSIYSYMQTNFFSWICSEVTNFEEYDKDYFTLSQSFLALDECQCKGRDYSGMPTIDLIAVKVDDESQSEEHVFYTFGPSQFELFPKVNKLLRTTFCNLGLWNIDN